MFNSNFKIYYEDTDAGGVVYYSNYLKYIERARTDLLNQLGFSLIKLINEYDSLFVVKKVNCEYIQSAKLEDKILVQTKIMKVKNASFDLEQNIFNDKNIIFKSSIVMVCVNSKMKPIKMPKILIEKLINA